MSTVRSYLAAATSADGSIYAFCGFNGAYLKTVEAITLTTGYLLYKN